MELRSSELLTPNLRLVREIGRGGMGSVWVADHLTLERQVAVKLISASLAGRGEARERFRREAKTAAGLRSPHLVQIFDHGITDDGTPYIVMELLTGASLAERLARRGRLSLGEVTSVVEQLARALGAAHHAGVVHRDVKPENVFLLELPDAEAGEIFVKLVDFGVARSLAGDGASSVTQAGALVGTPAYMSPEQLADGGSVGPPTDLWSLAVVAYRALTGKLPFAGATPVALWSAIAAHRYPRVTELVAGLPSELDAWFERGLAIEPADRFSSARAMAEELGRIRAHAGAAGAAPEPSDAAVEEPGSRSSAQLATVEFVERSGLSGELELDDRPGDAPRPRAAAARDEAAVQRDEATTRATPATPAPRTLPSVEAERAASTTASTVGGAAATVSPSSTRPRRRGAVPRLAVVLVAVGVVAWALQRRHADHPAAVTATGTAALADGGAADLREDAASPARHAPREPALGLRALEDYRSPRGATVVNLRSASLWSAASQDFAEAAEQPGAPVRWRAARHFADAELALAQGRAADAVAAFQRAIEAEPGWALAHAGLAAALSERGELDPALRAAERAAQLDPGWWGALAAAGRAYSAARRMDEAIQELRRALELAPDNAVLLSELALAYHAGGNDSAADRYAQQALERDPELVPARVLRAERALERSDGKTALDEASRATAVAPKSVAGRLAEADALALLGRRDEARETYGRVLDLVASEGLGGAAASRVAVVRKALAEGKLPPPRVPGARSAPGMAERARPAARAAPAPAPDMMF